MRESFQSLKGGRYKLKIKAKMENDEQKATMMPVFKFRLMRKQNTENSD